MIAPADISADAAALLSHWWSRPTDETRAVWARGWEVALDLAAELDIDPSEVEELRDAAQTADPESMLDEYERLFVGPGAVPCLPYESLWSSGVPRREAGSVMGPAALAVSDLYRTTGLTLRDDAHELPDHVVIEWEALAYALERGADEAAAELLETHLARWMDPFCTAVQREAEQPFYARLAALTRAWTAALAGG
jgi:TorA maturation chaperone TorD